MAQDEPLISAEQMKAAWMMAAAATERLDRIRAVPVPAKREGLHATLTAEGHRGFLITLDPGEQVAIVRSLLQGIGALSAEIARFNQDDADLRALHIWCKDRLCDDAFAMFCELLADKLLDMGVGAALAKCHEEFERLLKGAGSIPLGTLIGAIGEMLILLDAAKLDPSAARMWSGPRGERHDFRNGNIALEVKTTLRSEGKTLKVRITDLDQLEVPNGGELYLHAIKLEQAEGGPLSVSGLFEELNNALDADGRRDIVTLLTTLGIDPKCDRPQFSIMSRTTYQVSGDFPKLTASRLLSGRPDSGVTAVSYDLNLEQAHGFIVLEDRALSALVHDGQRS